MADYDCCDRRLKTHSSLEIAVSTSQALPSSTTESMWEGWTETSPISQCMLTEQSQLQHFGGGYNTSAIGEHGSSLSHHDLLSSWLTSGYQTVGSLHQQQQQHGGEEGSGITTMYQDEFSRMNICPSASSDYHGGLARPPAAGGGPDAPHQLYDVLQTCSSSAHTEAVGQSAQFLTASSSGDDIEPAHKLEVSGKQKTVHQMNTTTDLCSKGSSSSLPSVLNSCGQTMQAQHLGGQFDSSNYWPSIGSNVAVTSSSPQPSVCSGGGIRSSAHQREDQQTNTSCDSIILRHKQQQDSSRRGCEGDDALFHNSGPDLTPDQMFTELHGLFSRNPDAPTHSGGTDHLHQQLAVCDAGAAAGSYGDHSNWTQFTVSPSFSGPSSHHAGGFNFGIQDVLDRTMFDSSSAPPDSLSTATRREEVSPSSTAGTTMSTIHNYFNAAAADLTHATLPYRSSSSADLGSPEMGLQRKRPLSSGTEQVGENSAGAEDSVKRCCIVRCLWEQNIAQLQLANLPSEHQRNLWQLQSQALFGRFPSNSLTGGSSSSSSGSMDMSTGPALNTNGRPRARRGSATDPQSVYARHRRERINDRLKVLQHLVPNGAKVDIVTMLEEAINYVKFLQHQVRLLSSDELWIYAPTTYNGMDVSMGMHTGLLNQQA